MFKTYKTKLNTLNNKLFSKDVLTNFFCFILGVIFGTTQIKLNGIMQNFNSDFFITITWFDSFIGNYKYLLLIFLLAFTVFGRIAIPLVFVVNGYFLSEYIASSVAHSGAYGFFSSLIFIGGILVFLLPILLVFSKNAIDASMLIFNLVFGKNKALDVSRIRFAELIILFLVMTIMVLLLSFANIGVRFIFHKCII